MPIPQIDPNVKYRGTSSLRELNAETLRTLEGAIVIQGADLEPLAVIIPYETYLKMQLLTLPLAIEAARSNSVAKRIEAQSEKKTNKREAVIQARAESDLTAREVGRENIDYSDVESSPTTHVATLDAVGPPSSSKDGKASMENWRAKRRPLTKPKDQK